MVFTYRDVILWVSYIVLMATVFLLCNDHLWRRAWSVQQSLL